MSKLVFAFAAMAAAANAAQVTSTVPDYLPLQNPGEELCIVKGDFKNETGAPTYYKIELAACDDADVALLEFAGDGKQLSTKDDYCLDTLTKGADADIELVLRECPKKLTKSLEWTQVGVDQWQNGNDLCIEYNNKTELLVQAECATLDDGEKKSPQQFTFLEPPMVTCVAWSKNWICAQNSVLDGGKTCVGGTGAECASVCCVTPKTCYSEGYSQCPQGYKFVNKQCNNYNQAKCDWTTCCEPETTCKSAGFANKCPLDYTFVDRKCGNPGQPACDWNTCCKYDPTPIKCNTWNKCSRDYALKPQANQIWCVRGQPVQGPNYAPTCSDDICCDQTVQQTTCGRWNACDEGYEVKPNLYNKRCAVPVPMPLSSGGASEWCSNSVCCGKKVDPIPPPQQPSTCGASWTCDASSGSVPKLNSETQLCYPSAPGSLNPRCQEALCCEPDTCKNWSQRVVSNNNGVEFTGEDVCNNDPAKYSGLISKNDPAFTTPCTDAQGRPSVCQAGACCAPAIMPL